MPAKKVSRKSSRKSSRKASSRKSSRKSARKHTPREKPVYQGEDKICDDYAQAVISKNKELPKGTYPHIAALVAESYKQARAEHPECASFYDSERERKMKEKEARRSRKTSSRKTSSRKTSSRKSSSKK